ncbi:MAG: GFA family protein, partial [Sphingomicrobium sp.]
GAGEEAIGTFRSSSFGHRQFCTKCGTCLTIHVEYQPDWIDVAATTLDQPDAVAPGFHIFWGSKVSWFNPGDGLPRYEKFRPNTVGLEGTEPPE